MRLAFAGRNLVCLAAMPSEAFDFEDFERELAPGRPQTQVSNPDLALAQYRDFQIIVGAGRVQADFRVGAAHDVVRRTAARILTDAERFRPSAVGFNGLVRIEMDEAECQPLHSVLDADQLAERAGAERGRAGIKLVYELDDARWTLSMEPQVDEERTWLASVNRNYDEMPVNERRERVLGWFVALEAELGTTVRAVLREEESGDEHPA